VGHLRSYLNKKVIYKYALDRFRSAGRFHTELFNTMITFQNGFADGKMLRLQRTPYFLRVVMAEDGSIDALDQLGDEPRDNETVAAYRRISDTDAEYVTKTFDGEVINDLVLVAHYLIVEDQPDEETLRDTSKWRAWTTLNNTKHDTTRTDISTPCR
jgi:hypothetical protein